MRSLFSRFLEPRIFAEMSAAALKNNYRQISALVPGQKILPMVKADGYGHTSEWVARELLHMPDLYGFGVATLEEGATLRKELGLRGRKVPIIVFSGAAPWSATKGRFCKLHELRPVIASDEDWDAFTQGGWPQSLPYEIKFDTGMNRLGLSMKKLPHVLKLLDTLPPKTLPKGILSHLAVGENPKAKVSRVQKENFVEIHQQVKKTYPQIPLHLANSAAIWNAKAWGLEGLTDVVRTGLALYGISPLEKIKAPSLQPVMTLKAQVIRIHDLKKGESIGYGATFTAAKRMKVATVARGYADGLLRLLSNQAEVLVGKKKQKLLGTISMDLCAVSCDSSTQIGDSVEFLGPGLDSWKQARCAKTIPYELLTSVGYRVKRIYL